MSEIKLKQVYTMKGGVWDKIHESARRVYDPNGLSPTIQTLQGGNLEPKIIYEKPIVRKGWHKKACEVLNINGLTTCLHAQSNNLLQKIKTQSIIRKLTPRECFRLMAFTDTDFDKVKAVGMSDSQCYKQAGNSIVVSVLEAIFKEMKEE